MANTVTVGLAIGHGTGPELAAVFDRVLTHLGDTHGVTFHIVRSPRTYHTYRSLRHAGLDQIRATTRDDADHYEQYCRELADRSVTAVFRTAINAQSLYLVRQRLRAVKTDLLTTHDTTLLLIRDEAQGFYTGHNSHAPGEITRTMRFSRDTTEQVIGYALARAHREWPDTGPHQILMAYKFHLLDGALDDWVTDLTRRTGTPIRLCQPDTVNRDLIEHGLPGRTLLIAGNEWADIMHVVLLDRFGGQRQENHHTENTYLHPDVLGLIEYQTVHGSADDLTGHNTVNPTATVRAAAAIAQHHGGCAGAIDTVEQALHTAHSDTTTATTTDLVDTLLDHLHPHTTSAAGR
ncbi:isocitrate dehydrogenase [Actinophytocola xinjiangensis]|uniref:Isocitrate dehydrogenase n=1 Tax=Actinophytocola xinjiangensis TaxID=485602 RepID=A0A7Z1AWP7_9PSEU|nr:isocitrate/isopropylmalate family dehydrogenase [Actinophytocola xinjiangensis]OLF06770.1 isocitrate dehydrogenase [Actinophytocola xinjiangensis]